MGPKAKEQILQKWDPVSKRLVNIHQHGYTPPPPARTHITIADITLSYPSDPGDGVFFVYRLLSDKDDIVNVALYRSNGTFIGSASPRSIIAGATDFIDGININYTSGDIGSSLYIVVTPTSGDPVVSGMLVVVTPGGPVYTLVSTNPTFGGDEIIVDSNSNYYYRYNNSITKRTEAGDLIFGIGVSPEEAVTFEVDELQNIYITTSYVSYTNSLRKYSPTGVPIYTKNDFGDEPPQITTDVALNVYAYYYLDSTTTRIKKYNSTGSLLATLDITLGPYYTSAVAIDSTEHIYAVDSNDGFTVKKYSSSGVFQEYVALPVSTSISIDSADNFYVVTSDNIIKKYSSSFVELATINTPCSGSASMNVSRNGSYISIIDDNPPYNKYIYRFM